WLKLISLLFGLSGLFSLKKKIDDAVHRAEMLTPVALELEEGRQIKQEEMLRDYDLWEDVTKSNEILIGLADTTKAVNSLKDLRYKAEEAKLITQLAEMDVINYRLFKQAYIASVDVSKFMDQYEMSKLLSGPYDTEGACVIIKAGPTGVYPKIWAERLVRMYMKWAEKQGYRGRVVEKSPCKDGGIMSATLEFECLCAYGYLAGERGVHIMIRRSDDGSVVSEVCLAILFIHNSLQPNDFYC
ncbi:hypothetical protein GIB67_016608, partial [Kingdonia uniflora]